MEEIRAIYLCKPMGEKIAQLNGVVKSTVLYEKKLKDYSTLTFEVDKYIVVNGEKVVSNGYDELGFCMELMLDNIEGFKMQEPVEEISGEREYKIVTAYSNEKELETKKIVDFQVNNGTDGSYEFLAKANENKTWLDENFKPVLFYSEDKELSLMSIVLSKAPNWSVGYIDKDLKNLKLSFNVDERSIYGFLTNEVAYNANCVFTFDTVNRKVNAYKVEKYGEDTSVFVSYRNLLKSVTVENDEDSIVTRLVVLGENDLDIRNVNFNNRYIDDLDYFKNTSYMSQEMIDKLNYWESYKESKRENFKETIKQLVDYQEKVTEIEYRLPHDGCETTQWSKLNKEVLNENLKYYNSLLTPLRLSVDNSPRFDSNGEYIPWMNHNKTEVDNESYLKELYKAENGYGGYYTYYEIINYIIPNIQVAIYNVDHDQSNQKEYDKTFETNWNLYGTKELEIKRDMYKDMISDKLLYKYAKDWNAMSADEQKSVGIPKDLYNQYHDQYNLYNGYIGNTNKTGTIEYTLNALNIEISELRRKIEATEKNRDDILQDVSMDNEKFSFTDEEMHVYNSLIIEDVYTNNNIITTELDTYSSKVETQETLLQFGKEKLSEMSRPQYNFTTELENLFYIDEYYSWRESLKLGSYIRVEITDDYFVKLRVVGFSYNPCCISETITVDFSTMITSKSGRNDFTFLVGESPNSSTGGSSSSISSQGNSQLTDLPSIIKALTNSSYFKNILESTTNKVVSNNGEIISSVVDIISPIRNDVTVATGDAANALIAAGEANTTANNSLSTAIEAQQKAEEVSKTASQGGFNGKDGRGIVSITEYYLVSPNRTGISNSSEGWQPKVQTMDATNRYLWNYETITYTDGTEDTPAKIIGIYGDRGQTGETGVSVDYIFNYYLATSQESGVSTKTDGWTTDVQTITPEKKYLWNYEVTTFSDGTTNTTKPCIIGAYGDKGEQGLRGLQGLQGEQGIPGQDGQDGKDGKTTYFHIKYSANADGRDMSEGPNTYIGTYVDTTKEDSNDYRKYTWARFQGIQGQRGEQGIPGVGIDGKTSYLHIKYSNDGGRTFTSNNGENVGDYIGQYTDFNVNDSNSVSSYTWSKIKGEQGNPGATGNGISSIVNYYLATASASGVTTSTSGFTPIIQNVTAEKKYLWNYEVINYTNGTSETSKPCIIGAYGDKGNPGQDGKDGTSVTKVDVWYYLSSSNTSLTNGSWSTDVPTWKDGWYIWSKTVTTLSNSTTPKETAPVCITGAKGSSGTNAPNIKVVSKNYDVSANCTSSELYINDVKVATSNVIGHTVFKIDKTTFEVLEKIAYKTYSNDETACDNMAAYIKGLSDCIVVIMSSDACRVTTNLRIALRTIGGNENGTCGNARYSHYLVGMPGLSVGQGYEELKSGSTAALTCVVPLIAGQGIVYNGQVGATGSTGNGVSKVEELYAKTTSKTDIPSDSAFSAYDVDKHTWTTGSYIWTATRVTYTNGTVSVVGKSCDSSWEAVNEVVIGGRNLLLNTSKDLVTKTCNKFYYLSDNGFLAYAGKTVTARVWLESCDTDAFIQIWTNSGSGTWHVGNTIKKGNKGYLTLTCTLPASFTLCNLVIGNNNTTTVTIKEAKFELGNKATDYTPAPEDVQSQIDTSKKLLDDIASDSKLTPSEKQEAKREWLDIATEYSKYTTQCTNYGVSLIAYKNAYDALDNYLNTINTGVIFNMDSTTDISRDAFNNKFATYYSCKVDMLNALEYAKAKKEADNITVGGRNLLSGTKDFSGAWDYIDNWDTESEKYLGLTVKSRNYSWLGLSQGCMVEKGETYTFSCYVKSNTDKTHIFTYYNGQQSRVEPHMKTIGACSEWKRVSLTFTAIDTGIINPRIEIESQGEARVYVCGFQLEKGNKVTDWTPSIEDVQAGIDNAVNAAAAAQTSANGKNTVFYLDGKNNSSGKPTVVPTGTTNCPLKVNDLWFNTGEGNCSYRWNGSQWERKAYGNAAIDTLDAGKITSGTISSNRIDAATLIAKFVGANKIKANNIDVSDLNALGATIAGWEINSNRIRKFSPVTDGVYEVYLQSPTSSSDWILASCFGSGAGKDSYKYQYSPLYISADGYLGSSNSYGTSTTELGHGTLKMTEYCEVFGGNITFEYDNGTIVLNDDVLGNRSAKYGVGGIEVYRKNGERVFYVDNGWLLGAQITANAPLWANKGLYFTDPIKIMNTNRITFEDISGATKFLFSIDNGLDNTSSSGYLSIIKEKGGSYRTIFRPETTGLGYLGTTGYRWNTAFFTNAITTSDRKLKKYISTIEADFAKNFVLGFNPCIYKMKKQDGANGVRWKMGGIAQEVEELAKSLGKDLSVSTATRIQEVTTVDEDGKEHTEKLEFPYYGEETYIDDDGNEVEITDEMLSWGLDYNQLIAPLYKFSQVAYQETEELKEEVDSLKEENKALKDEIADMKAQLEEIKALLLNK